VRFSPRLLGLSLVLAGCQKSQLVDPPTESMTAATTTSTTSTETAGSTSTGSTSTTGVPTGCGDGISEPHQWCYEEIPIAGLDVREIAAGDLDGNKGDEIVVWAKDGLWVVGADLQAEWVAPIDPFLWGFYSRLYVADVDGDGSADVVAHGDDAVVMFRNKNGALDPIATMLTPVEYTVKHLAVTDVDGDSRSEFFGIDQTDVYMHREENGKLVLVQEIVGLLPCEFAETIESTDLNSDGKRDIVVLSLGCEDQLDNVPFYVLLGQDDGTVTLLGEFPTGGTPRGIAFADFDGDKTLDVITSNENTDDMSILLGKGDGTFHPQERIPFVSRAVGLIAGSFDSTPKAEVLYVGTDSTSVLEPLGDWHSSVTVMGMGIVIDLNGDELSDLALYVFDDKPGQPFLILRSMP
jgi:hypothetical protein